MFIMANFFKHQTIVISIFTLFFSWKKSLFFPQNITLIQVPGGPLIAVLVLKLHPGFAWALARLMPRMSNVEPLALQAAKDGKGDEAGEQTTGRNELI